MKRILAALTALCLLLAGCAQAEEEEAVFTQEMIERSLVSVGNTERFHAAVEKAQRGEEVVIAYLGGSITEGATAQPQSTRCYAYLSAQQFAEKFMPDAKQLKYVNAGISGTPSTLGVTRVKQDVLAKQPDIVFVEFAVNDGNDPMSKIVYESLVCRLLNSETKPAVILIFTFLESGYSCQEHMQQVGERYDLGMVSVRDAVQPEITGGRITWRDYSNDGSHPHTAGHAFVADAIGYYFDQAALKPAEPFSMPAKARYGRAFEGLVNLDKDSPMILSGGSFSWGPDRCYSYASGWKHLAAKGGTEPMVFEAECRFLTIAFKQEQTKTRGSCEVWVDGKRVKTLQGSSSSAWGNVVTEIVQLGLQSKMHTIELRMAEGDENKNFTVLDIGIVK